MTRIQTANGSAMQTLVPPIIAIFEQGGPTPEEIRLALERFKFTGLAEGENPARRISIYDTDEQQRQHGWSDELKAEIETVLDRDQGRNYFKVEPPPHCFLGPPTTRPQPRRCSRWPGRWAWIPLRSSPTSAKTRTGGRREASRGVARSARRRLTCGRAAVWEVYSSSVSGSMNGCGRRVTTVLPSLASRTSSTTQLSPLRLRMSPSSGAFSLMRNSVAPVGYRIVCSAEVIAPLFPPHLALWLRFWDKARGGAM